MSKQIDKNRPTTTPGAFDHQSSTTLLLDGTMNGATERTAECLRAGGVVAIPTDTVYGVASSVSDPTAIQRIFDVKRRPADRPLPVLISSIEALAKFSPPISAPVKRLLETFWPGPLTVVVPCRIELPAGVLGPGHTVGVRVPDHPLAIDVIARAGGAVACTSANRSGEPPAASAQEALAALGDDIDLVLDGGEAPGGVPSTVVAIEDGMLRVLREGALAESDLQAVLNETNSNQSASS